MSAYAARTGRALRTATWPSPEMEIVRSWTAESQVAYPEEGLRAVEIEQWISK